MKPISVLIILFLITSCQNEKKIIRSEFTNTTSQIAYAQPLKNISIDGDLKDWPSTFKKYPINELLENEINGADDLNAKFQVGYSLQSRSIYIAVTVIDDNYLIDPDKGSLSDTQDQCLLYLDKQHDPKGSGVNVFSFNALYKEIDDANSSWDPGVKNTDWKNIQYASKRQKNTTIYEIEIKFDTAIKAGKAIGLDLMIYDSDSSDENAPLTRVSWKNTDGKTNVPFKLGTVILVDHKVNTGTIEGYLKWKKDSLGLPINKIRISSTSDPSYWIRKDVDTTGYYSAVLPKGTYIISPEWGIYNGGDIKHKINKERVIKVDIKPNTTIQAPNLEIEVIKPLDLIPNKGILLENPLDKYKQIDQFINAYIDFFEIPGVSLAIIEDGNISYSNTYGIKNTYTREPVNSETIFEAASITKPVFGFAVSSLVEKGIIDLDKPLYQYLPFEEIAYDEHYKLITARHVLSHKTGFPNWRSPKMTINFEPGTQFGYSGEGFEYLKRVIEHITQKDIVQVLEEEVIMPLDLENIYFEKSDLLFKLVAHGHDDYYPHKISLPNKAGMAWSMHTEAKSFAKFAVALINKTTLQKKTYDDMFYRHTVTDKYEDLASDDWKSFFGLSLQLEKTPWGTTFGHGGNNGDFKCEFKVYENLKMGFVIFTNGNTGGELAYKYLEQFLITGKTKEY